MTPITFLPTVATVADRHSITMTHVAAGGNPGIVGEVPQTAKHFKVTLRCDGRKMVVWFTMTPEHGSQPDVLLVLDGLAEECALYEANKDLVDQTTSESSLLERLRKQSADLAVLVGQRAYRELLNTRR